MPLPISRFRPCSPPAISPAKMKPGDRGRTIRRHAEPSELVVEHGHDVHMAFSGSSAGQCPFEVWVAAEELIVGDVAEVQHARRDTRSVLRISSVRERLEHGLGQFTTVSAGSSHGDT